MSFLTQTLMWTKLKFLPDEKFHGLDMQRGSCKNKMAYFLRFWVKEHRQSDFFSQEK